MEQIWKNTMEMLGKQPGVLLGRVAGAALLLIVGFIAIRYLSRLINAALQKSKIDRSIATFLESFVSIALKIMLIVMAAIQLGVPSATFVAILGSCGLAIGLALQGSLTNLAGGLMILIFHPFKVGHYIKAGEDAGTVKEIGIFYTTLETLDRKTVVLPNGKLSNGVVTNFSVCALRRIDLDWTLLPEASVETVCALMERITKNHPKVVQSEGIESRLYEVKDGALVFGLRAYARQRDWWATKLDLTEQILQAFEEAGIRLASPMRTVQNRQAE